MKSTNLGVSLFEIVIVVGIFAMVAVLITRSTFLTLRGTKKSDSQIRVKENLEYGLSVIDRQLRNADVITSTCNGGTPFPCNSTTRSRIDYTNTNGTASFFACNDVGPTSGYITASDSARLTSTEITITDCSFVYSPQDGPVLPGVTISVSGRDLGTSGVESSQVSVSAKVFLRTY